MTTAAQLTPKRKSYQLSKPEIEFHMMQEIYAALRMYTCAEQTIHLGKDDISIYILALFNIKVLVILIVH